MRLVIQRVISASVHINENEYSSIKNGLLIFIGITQSDTEEDIDWLIRKLLNLRIFPDENNKMNLSVNDIHGEILLISQFTLFASTVKGNRPSFTESARPEIALPIYNQFIEKVKSECKLVVKTGAFGADMKIQLINDGPVTIIIDSKLKE